MILISHRIKFSFEHSGTIFIKIGLHPEKSQSKYKGIPISWNTVYSISIKLCTIKGLKELWKTYVFTALPSASKLSFMLTFGIVLQIPKLYTYSWHFQILSPPKDIIPTVRFMRTGFMCHVCSTDSAWGEQQKQDRTSSPGAVIKVKLLVSGATPYSHILTKVPRKNVQP